MSISVYSIAVWGLKDPTESEWMKNCDKISYLYLGRLCGGPESCGEWTSGNDNEFVWVDCLSGVGTVEGMHVPKTADDKQMEINHLIIS